MSNSLQNIVDKKKLNTSIKNIEGYIKQLRDSKKIEFRGSSKTGGYYVK